MTLDPIESGSPFHWCNIFVCNTETPVRQWRQQNCSGSQLLSFVPDPHLSSAGQPTFLIWTSPSLWIWSSGVEMMLRKWVKDGAAKRCRDGGAWCKRCMNRYNEPPRVDHVSATAHCVIDKKVLFFFFSMPFSSGQILYIVYRAVSKYWVTDIRAFKMKINRRTLH